MSLRIGGLIFEQIDQADFTGPFEVLSRVPGAEFLVIGKTLHSVRDARGLILTPEHAIGSAPDLDVLVVPGGNGVNALMEDAAVLDFVRRQAEKARIVLSVCTGALVCGAAGLLSGRRATTHWASHHLLAGFGAVPVHERVVTDGKFVFAAGVTSGIDASLAVAALLCGPDAARRIQLYLQYAPEPPFTSGTPEEAPAGIVAETLALMEQTLGERAVIAERAAARLRPR